MSSCPICGKPGVAAYRPFCSRRCADVDLGRWLTESYSIPAENVDEAGDDVADKPEDSPAPKPH
jgi:uncharacterized protein